MKEKIRNFLKENWVKLVVISFLFGALGNHFYSYYQMLKWTVLGAGIYFAYSAYSNGNKTWPWIFGIAALLFNPIIPFYFSKETWKFLDIIVAILFIASFFKKNVIKK